jgi:hypothetical protein
MPFEQMPFEQMPFELVIRKNFTWKNVIWLNAKIPVVFTVILTIDILCGLNEMLLKRVAFDPMWLEQEF